MRIPIEWLREFIDTGLKAEEIADKLTMAGLEVEGIEEADNDKILLVNVTPNRPDCLNVYGIARELSAITGLPAKLPEISLQSTEKSSFKVEIADGENCSRYTGRIINGVKISSSPEWMKKRLEKCNIRSINNVVDVTNYVLLELGHPLHAFDLDKIKGGSISVGQSRAGGKITTLDGVERVLSDGLLLIYDTERPIAVAGVMGGAETEVTGNTKNIFLESAYFRPQAVRKSSRALGLSSDSSYRFERGTDIEMLETALDRTACLIAKIAGGRISDKIDVYPQKKAPVSISVKLEKIGRVLGADIKREEVLNILKCLMIDVKESGETLSVTPPSFRGDLICDADIIEEVARIYGYGRIPTSLPVAKIAPPYKGKGMNYSIKEAIRSEGFNEAINFSFMNEKHFETLNIPEGDTRRRAVRIKNPLRKEDSLLRTMLAPSLIENFLYNFHRGAKNVRLFELSMVFTDGGETLPKETLRLAGLLHKDKGPALWKDNTEGFYVLKGVVESLFGRLRVKGFSFSPSTEPFLHPGKSSDIYISGEKAGFAGHLSPETIDKLDLKSKPEVLVFDIDMDKALGNVSGKISYRPIPRFPSIERDISIVLDESITSSSVIGFIKSFRSEFIADVSVFDYFKGGNIPAGKKSLAFSISYRSMDRTLTDEEVETFHKDLIAYLVEKTVGEVRK